jgi:uncharacterized protein (TIGR02118 family)
MITRIYLLRRLPRLSVEEFRAYWRDVHAPMVRRVPGLAACVQYHCLDGPYDGVNMLTYADAHARQVADASAEWERVVADCDNFPDWDSLVELPVAPHRVL